MNLKKHEWQLMWRLARERMRHLRESGTVQDGRVTGASRDGLGFPSITSTIVPNFPLNMITVKIQLEE